MTVTADSPGGDEPGQHGCRQGDVPRIDASAGSVRSSARRVAGIVSVVLLVFLISLAVRLAGLDLASTTDEGYWMQRTVRFGAALARGDLASTYRAGHPGVTVMWTGVLGIGPDRLAPFLPERFINYEVLERDPGYLGAFSAARRAVAVATSALVTLAVVLAWRLFGVGPALAGGTLLLLDPYVIGMTRLLHVDALLAPLMTVSALAGLVYWLRSPRLPYLLLSATAGGLALLTKAPAGMLSIFFGLVVLASTAHGWRDGRRPSLCDLSPLLGWGAVLATTYVLLFPALWTDPVGRVQSLIAFVSVTGLQPHNGNFFLGQPIFDDPGPFYYLVALPLRMSPLVALGLGLLALPAHRSERRVTVRWLVVYAVLFAGLMTLASKKFDRYLLPALMVCDLLAGIGLWRLGLLIGSRLAGRERPHPQPPAPMQECPHPPTPSPCRGRGGEGHAAGCPLPRAGSGVRGEGAPLILAALVAAVQLVLLARVWPYPIAYYNPLAGGPERARQLVMVGWGEGLEQVATYLNGLPDAESLYVVTSYNHVVRPRFVGTTAPMTPYLLTPRDPTLPAPDYVVLYANAIQRRQFPPEVLAVRLSEPPIFVAHVNGQEYAWVYQIPRAGPRPTGPAPADTGTDGEEN